MAERRYWDSDCFLGWLLAEADKVDKCAAVLTLVEKGDAQILTSTLTLAEVLMLRGRPKLLQNRRTDVPAFFNRKGIEPVPLTRRIAESARDLVWDHGVDSKDAVHVATALFTEADVLNTFDGSLIAKSGRIGRPPLTIENPTVTAPELNL